MKYTKSNKNEFFNELKILTDKYFKQKQISRYANSTIVVKGAILILIYLGAYATIFVPAASAGLLLSAYVIMGLCAVMLVFNLVHDASHGAISKTKWINKCVCYLGDFLGINTYIWDIRHNVQHHTFTNVLGGDLIIENIPLIRLSQHQVYKKFHKYQLLYAPVFYMLYSFYWMFVIDFKLFLKKDICNLHNIKHPSKEWVILIVTKLFYVFYMLVIPWLFTPLNFLTIASYFFIMHFAAGLLLSFVAVLGHFVEGPSFPETKNGLIENSWSEHELETTIDFAPKSKIVNWITGGLNTHVAHHLFPNICHVHYYDLTSIIEDYCMKNNYDYKKESLFGGLRSHFRYLKYLSNPTV
ncbi:MAG TPA: acyl-CoA desaturase [Chitinophagaceae bacterium]|nr:acyl-CoA desaturase [Chitinophagaceae bacterium]